MRRPLIRLLSIPLLCVLSQASALPTHPASGAAPTADDDAYTTDFGENLSVDRPGVLANDTDPESDPLKAIPISSSGASGELLLRLTAPDPVLALLGAPWTGPGTPEPIAVPIPAAPLLAGLSVHAQGVLFDLAPGAGVPIGLTEALELRLGL